MDPHWLATGLERFLPPLAMTKLFWTAAIACGACAVFAGAPALADSHTSTEHHGNYANYWLLLHTTSTEAEIEPPKT